MISQLFYKEALTVVKNYETQLDTSSSLSEVPEFKLEEHLKSNVVNAIYNYYNNTFRRPSGKLSIEAVKKLSLKN